MFNSLDSETSTEVRIRFDRLEKNLVSVNTIYYHRIIFCVHFCDYLYYIERDSIGCNIL